MDNSKTLKAISAKAEAPQKSSAVKNMMSSLKKVPGVDAIAKTVKATKPKQIVDIAVFTIGIYLMYRFGKAVADGVEAQMPTEKNMMDMMKQMQGGPGMMPPPPM